MRSRSKTSWRAACRARRAIGTTPRLQHRAALRPNNPRLRSSVRRGSINPFRYRSPGSLDRWAWASDEPVRWQCRHRTIELARPVVMGILNVTPDSFSDGGRYFGFDAALDRAAQMVAEGAAIIDVGGESTRPGAAAVDAAAELERTVPVIERIAGEFDVAISIDTSRSEE